MTFRYIFSFESKRKNWCVILPISIKRTETYLFPQFSYKYLPDSMTRSGEFLFFVAASANVLPYSQEKKKHMPKNGESYCLFIFLHLNFRKVDLDWRPKIA